MIKTFLRMDSVDLIYDAIAIVTKKAQAQALQVLTSVGQYIAAAQVQVHKTA